jgi:thiol-disulfide isomerase/thioredoxin
MVVESNLVGRKLSPLVLGFAAIVSSVSLTRAGQSAVEWQYDYEAGLLAAQAKGCAVLLDFFADWCEPCRHMDEHVWTDQELVRASRRVIAIRVDFDKERKLARRYEVNAIPTVLFTDPWGTELGRRLGYTGAADLLRLLSSLPEDFSPVKPWQELIARDSADALALVRIGAFYREKKLLIAADQFYERALKSVDKRRDPEVEEQAHVGLGLNSVTRGEYKKARKHFQQCVEKLPAGINRPVALYGLGLTHLRLGDRMRAEHCYQLLQASYAEHEGTALLARELSAAAPR